MKKEIEIVLIEEGVGCNIHSFKYDGEEHSEFEKFLLKFENNTELAEDFNIIVNAISLMLDEGATERRFRYEGPRAQRVVAIPVASNKFRLYCIRLNDKTLIVGNGDIKRTRTWQEDPQLKCFVENLLEIDKKLQQSASRGYFNFLNGELYQVPSINITHCRNEKE